MNLKFLIPILLFFILLVILIKNTNNSIIYDNNDNNDNNNVFDLHVYDWGAQVAIKNITSILNYGDVYNTKFEWSKKPIKYSGFYHLDTGSHLLVDMIMMNRSDLINNLKKNNIKYDDLQQSGYIYLQGGTPPLNNYQNNLKIDNKNYDNVPVGLMALDGQHMMEKERESVNGVFGLSYIGDNHNLKKYSILDKLLENVNNKSVLLDFKNSKMTLGESPPSDFHFKGKILKTDNNNLHRMEVSVIDSDNNKEYNILIDTGTLYSQFEYSGKVVLKGSKDSSGIITLQNSRLLPLELSNNIRQIILGYNDLYNGWLYINYDTNMIYLNQNY
tara:strand:+ start:394 stop:1383 length:990 start_codon:yes stop_codon:yes gene_type:complete